MKELLRISEIMDDLNIDSEHSRHKRSVDHVSSVIHEIQESLDALEQNFNTTSLSDEKIGSKCFVEDGGKVNCSSIIYEDEKSWKKSRIQIDLLIKVLKKKITDLKDIKKHLKEHRPLHIKEDYEESSNEEKELELPSLNESEERVVKKKKNHSHENISGSSHSGKKGKKNRHKEIQEDLEEGPLIDMSFYTTEKNEIPEIITTTSTTTSATINVKPIHRQRNHSHHQSGRHRNNSTRRKSEVLAVELPIEVYTSTVKPKKIKTTTEQIIEISTTLKDEISTTQKFEEEISSSTSATTETNLFTTTIKSNSLEDLLITEPTNATIIPIYLKKQKTECYCAPEVDSQPDEKDLEREARRKLKEERQRKKTQKRNKKAKLEKECLSEKMNCFSHDSSHWRTAPLWNDKPFCFCMNANNNTYSCLRTINQTHNFLYCEFVTGLVTYYNLRIDPFETQNRASFLTTDEKSYLHDTLEFLKGCRGKACTLPRSNTASLPDNSLPSNPRGTKRKFVGKFLFYLLSKVWCYMLQQTV